MGPVPLTEVVPFDRAMRRYGNMSSYAADTFRQLIVSGHLLPGEQLYIEEIAERLHISATPVREALFRLKVEGFVDSVHRQGFRVHPTSPEDIADVFLVHADVAGELAARAVEIITDDQVRKLTILHYEMMAASLRGDMSTLEELDNAFHRTLNLVVDAPILHRIVALCTKYVPRHFYASIEGWPEATRSEHTEIIEALETRDAEAARHTVRDHILHSGELLAAHFRTAIAVEGRAGGSALDGDTDSDVDEASAGSA